MGKEPTPPPRICSKREYIRQRDSDRLEYIEEDIRKFNLLGDALIFFFLLVLAVLAFSMVTGGVK